MVKNMQQNDSMSPITFKITYGMLEITEQAQKLTTLSDITEKVISEFIIN